MFQSSVSKALAEERQTTRLAAAQRSRIRRLVGCQNTNRSARGR